MAGEFLIYIYKLIIGLIIAVVFAKKEIHAIIDRKKSFDNKDFASIFYAAIVVFIIAWGLLFLFEKVIFELIK